MVEVFRWLAKTFVGKLITSYAISAITNKLFGAKNNNSSNSPTYSFGALQTQANNTLVMPLCYGKVKMAGNDIWASPAGATQSRLISFGFGNISGFEDIRLNDILLKDEVIFSVQYKGTAYNAFCRYTAKTFSISTKQNINSALTTLSFDCSSATIKELVEWINKQTDWNAAGFNNQNFSVSDIREMNTKNGGWSSPVYYGSACKSSPLAIHTIIQAGCNYTAYLGDGEQLIDKRVTGKTQEDKAKIVGGLKYDAYLAITATASDKLNSNYNVTTVVKGRMVRVYTDLNTFTVEWSDNPAWCVLDFLMNFNGCAIKEEDINIQTFIDSAKYCDEIVNGQKRFTLNIAVDEKKSKQDWLDEMLIVCQGYKTYQNGQHGIFIDKPEIVSQVFDVNIDEDLQLEWSEINNVLEKVQITYLDPSYKWAKVGAIAKTANFQNRSPISKTVEMFGVTNFNQASRLAWFYLNQTQTCKTTYIYKTNKRAINRSIGDVVEINDPPVLA